MKRQILTFAACAAMALTALGQSLPQFTYDNYDGWSYNNPGLELNGDNIGDGRIVLYVSCQGIDSISSTVTWFTRNIANSEFDLTRTALTLAIDDVDGNPVDSVTVTPTTPGVRTHMLDFTIPVPKGMTTARLRLVAWRANVVSCGAVRSATFTAESSSGPTTSTGDVDGSGTA